MTEDLQAENQRLRSERDLLRRRLAEVEASFRDTVSSAQAEILSINEALTQANAQLHELDRMKDAFLSMVTHELRTPLTVISGTAELLHDGIYGALSETQARQIAQISDQAARLRQLVNDLLDLSKMEAGMMKLRRDWLDPRTLAAAVVSQLQLLAEAAQVTLEQTVAHDLPEIYCDGQRVEQILTNLITNALKFTPPQGRVTVNAKLLNDALEFCITDTGAGIDAAAQQHIFDRFYQVHTHANAQAKGTGLGLAIVKHLVELHEGSVSVSSQPNEGSTFCFTLPLNSAT
jgi:signal transduction histidine kinase